MRERPFDDSEFRWAEIVSAKGLFWATRAALKPDFRQSYDGDRIGRKDWTDSVPTSCVCGMDARGKAERFRSVPQVATALSRVVVVDGVLYVSARAEMKEGTSSVRAFQLP
jgi:hypothetical protein